MRASYLRVWKTTGEFELDDAVEYHDRSSIFSEKDFYSDSYKWIETEDEGVRYVIDDEDEDTVTATIIFLETSPFFNLHMVENLEIKGFDVIQFTLRHLNIK